MIDEEKEDLDLNQLFASIRQRHKKLAYLQNDVPALVAQLNDENPTAAQAAEEQLCDFRDLLYDQEDDCYFFLDGTILEPGIAIDLNQILKAENFTELQKNCLLDASGIFLLLQARRTFRSNIGVQPL